MSKENQKNMSCRKAVIRHLRISVSDGMVNERKEIRRSRIKCGMTPHFMGFTLIELLVVVLIIGILAAVAVPQYQKAVWKSRYATLKSTVNAFAQAEEAYYMANGTYARDADELSLSFPGVISSSVDEARGTYHFSWGYCDLYHQTGVSSYVECFLKKNGSRFLSYARYFQHAPIDPGKQYCGAFGTSSLSDLQHRICKSESGLDAPGTHGWAW